MVARFQRVSKKSPLIGPLPPVNARHARGSGRTGELQDVVTAVDHPQLEAALRERVVDAEARRDEEQADHEAGAEAVGRGRLRCRAAPRRSAPPAGCTRTRSRRCAPGAAAAAAGSMPASRHHAFLNSGPYHSPPSTNADTAAAITASQLRSIGGMVMHGTPEGKGRVGRPGFVGHRKIVGFNSLPPRSAPLHPAGRRPRPATRETAPAARRCSGR